MPTPTPRPRPPTSSRGSPPGSKPSRRAPTGCGGPTPSTQAIAAFQGTVPPPPAVTTYNRAVRDYEDERNGLLRSPVASLFGYDSRPQLVLSS